MSFFITREIASLKANYVNIYSRELDVRFRIKKIGTKRVTYSS